MNTKCRTGHRLPERAEQKAEKARHDGQNEDEGETMENFTKILENSIANMENNASTTYVLSMNDFLESIQSGSINLPPFQRIGTAWSADKVIALAQTLANLESIGCFNVAIVNGEYYLVDGQQRSNALAHILNTLEDEDKSIITDYEALVNVTEFQSFAQMADNFVRINGTSGLTSAQKMKAELLTEIQLEDFNRLSWSDAMTKLTSVEKDSKEVVLSGETEEESIKLQAMSIIKQSKCEELTALLLAMYLNKKRIGKGFTTSAKANFNGAKNYDGLKGKPLDEASTHALEFVKEYTKTRLNPTNKKPAFVGLVYYLVLIEKLPLEEVGAFVDYLAIGQQQLFVTPKSELYANGKQLFHSGESNSFDQFKNREKTIEKFFKAYEEWKTKPQTSDIVERFNERYNVTLAKILNEPKKEESALKVTVEKLEPKKESKPRPLSASALEALEK